MPAQPHKHVAAYTIQAWGHARPLITLCARFVKLRPDVHITFLTTDTFFDRARAELARSFEDGDEAAQRARLLSIGHIDLLVGADVEGKFAKSWATLAEERSLVCAKTGISYPALHKPDAAIMDFFAVSDIDVIKSVSGNTTKLYGWLPGMMCHILHVFGPEKYGGKGNIRIKAEEEAARTGESYDVIVERIGLALTEDVIRIPGLPPMYEYENTAQDFPLPPGVASVLFPRVYEMLESLDGLFMITSQSYEPETVAATKAWMEDTGRSAYVAGPLIPSASKGVASANEKKQSAEAADIQIFLDDVLKTSGEKSLLYISFGSLFWPVKTPEKLWTFLDVVMEHNIPFILSHASPFTGPIPEEIEEKVKNYGKGLLSPWTPQQLILDHPATGWFVAHGGHNGVTEAIVSNVPMILWPFRADQPMNTIMLTEKHGVAYELREVRSGEGLKPTFRNGFKAAGTLDALKTEARDILTKAFGEDGKEKRARLEILRKLILGEWEQGGASKRDVSAFLGSL